MCCKFQNIKLTKMDYNTMTPDKLAHEIFKRSGYAVNYQDCKTRIENCCVKYANGDFEINGISRNVSTRNNSYYFAKGMFVGGCICLIVVLLALI